jgi:transcriptional regulator with XRE-family HTH domain
MLRQLRHDAGLSATTLADRLGRSQAWVSKVETGRLVPAVGAVERWANATHASPQQAAEVIDLARAERSTLQSWRGLHRQGFEHHQAEIQRWEQQASRVRLFQSGAVPGLLQTAGYMRHNFELGSAAARRNINRSIESGLGRQRVLDEPGRTFEFVVTEGALRWRLCPTDLHVAQLDHLAAKSRQGNISIGIIPWARRVHARQVNMFCMFDDAFLLVETVTAELSLKDPQDIEAYAATFTALQQAAEYGDDARVILDSIANDLRQLGN